jgi:hypothetical protein
VTIRELLDAIAAEALVISQSIEKVKELVLWEANWLDANVEFVVVAASFYATYGYVSYQNFKDSNELTSFVWMQCFASAMLYAAYKMLTWFL